MDTPFTQIYTNYVTSMNKLVYETNLSMVKATQDFTKQVWQQNPMKDMFNLDSMLKSDIKKAK